MAKDRRTFSLDAPRGRAGMLSRSPQPSRDRFGRFSEAFARAMGTSGFLIGMTVFVAVWLWWNTAMPREMQFDAAENLSLIHI